MSTWTDWFGGGGSDTGGGGFDWGGMFSSILGNDDFWNATTKLIIEHPELDYDKIMEMAIQQTNLNRPDIETPSGRMSWEIDPETGKSIGRQEYREPIQGLFEMLVRRAGGDIDPYSAPESMRGQMLEGYMNDRETHMGLPLSEWTAPDFRREGAREPVGNYWDPDDEDSDPANRRPPMGGDPTDRGVIGGGNSTGRGEAQDLAWQNELADFVDWSQAQGHDWSSQNWNFNDALNEYSAQQPEGSTPSALEEWGVENAGNLGQLLGRIGTTITGIPGLGSLGKWIAGLITDNYWNNNQWQNPITDPNYQPTDDLIDDWMAGGAFNFDGLTQGQSPAGQSGFTGNTVGGWRQQSDGTFRHGTPGNSRRGLDPEPVSGPDGQGCFRMSDGSRSCPKNK